ncbi:unnamed protein product [Rotaria sordida]|uniref:Uncharacterized protein n=1 Tax=Rotaria sordida TaxID=392033 RepID=A0A814M8S9_9BILA|nr:unnamed protein product [Rotaria sordida]
MQATLIPKATSYTTEIPASIISTPFIMATMTIASSSISTTIYPTSTSRSQMSITTSELTMITTPFFQTTSFVLSTTTTTTVTLLETTSITTEKSFTTFNISSVITPKSFISIFKIPMTQSILSKTGTTTSYNIIPTTILQTPTKNIQQTFYSITTAPSLLMTVTELMRIKEKTFSKTHVETKLFTMMSNSTLSLVTTQKSLVSSFTSSKRSEESHNILLYILYSLLFVIISIAIISFIDCYHYYRRKQQQLFNEYSITILSAPTSTNTYSSTNNDRIQSKNLSNTSNTFLSLLLMQSNETQSLKKVNKGVEHIVNDN